MRFRRDLAEFPVKAEVKKGLVYLDKNENPFDLPPELKDLIAEDVKRVKFNRYPHATSLPLRERIAELYGLDAENVAVGNGCDELLQYLTLLFEGKYIVVTPPTFGMYTFYARLHGRAVKEIPLSSDFRIDGEKVVSEGKDAGVVFIPSPNNPTGNLQPEEEILRILDSGIPVVVDEAYYEFSGKTLAPVLSEYPNLIIARTFSKAFGLAAIRAGYILADRRVVESLYRIRAPFSMNSMTMSIAMRILEHRELVNERVGLIIEERERLRRELGKCTYPSDANFLLVHLDAYDFLLERGIVVRKLASPLQGFIRVTVGARWENELLLSALREYMEGRECG